jgi:hypothetical protein
MKRTIFILLVFSSFLTSCRKNDDPPVSGIFTINNSRVFSDKLQTWFIYGFTFSKAALVSNLETPPPDITIDNDGTLAVLILQAVNFQNSFYKVGEFADAASAEQAFKNLTSPVVSQWAEWGNPVKPNQVWLYRTANEHYAKLRIISTISETRNSFNYAECTFQWTYQPDGSLTFPGK